MLTYAASRGGAKPPVNSAMRPAISIGVASSRYGPRICTQQGSPSAVRPTGQTVAGLPVNVAEENPFQHVQVNPRLGGRGDFARHHIRTMVMRKRGDEIHRHQSVWLEEGTCAARKPARRSPRVPLPNASPRSVRRIVTTERNQQERGTSRGAVSLLAPVGQQSDQLINRIRGPAVLSAYHSVRRIRVLALGVCKDLQGRFILLRHGLVRGSELLDKGLARLVRHHHAEFLSQRGHGFFLLCGTQPPIGAAIARQSPEAVSLSTPAPDRPQSVQDQAARTQAQYSCPTAVQLSCQRRPYLIHLRSFDFRRRV